MGKRNDSNLPDFEKQIHQGIVSNFLHNYVIEKLFLQENSVKLHFNGKSVC